MATLNVIYPRESGGTFDYDYYQNRHLPLAGERWSDVGMVGGEALLGKASVDGSASPYFAIGILHFNSADDLQSALSGEHASEITGDIRNFTNVQPVIQINERITP